MTPARPSPVAGPSPGAAEAGPATRRASEAGPASRSAAEAGSVTRSAADAGPATRSAADAGPAAEAGPGGEAGPAARQAAGPRRWRPVVAAVGLPLVAGGVLLGLGRLSGAPSGLSDAAFYLAALAATLGLAGRRSWGRLLGARRPSMMALGIAGGVAVVRCLLWLVVVPVHLDHDRAGLVVVAMAVQLLVVAPSEEAQFRGLVLSRLLARTRVPIAVAVSVAIFALLHLYGSSAWLLPALVADGVLFTVLRRRGDSLAPAIVVHGLFNAVVALLPAQSSVPEATVVAYVVSVVVVDAVLCVALTRWWKAAPCAS